VEEIRWSTRRQNQAIALDTALGNAISNWQDAYIGNPGVSQALERDVETSQSSLRALTHARYNCHGLTFASRRASVHADRIRLIISEDGYDVIEEPNVMPGDCVVYYSEEGEAEHSGIVVERSERPTDFKVVSKWGPGGPEVLHWLRQVPSAYSKIDIRFYRIQPSHEPE